MIPPPPPAYHGPPARPWWAKPTRVVMVLIPLCSLGFLAWVPPLREAIRRRSAGAWLWFAGYLAASVLEVVLADAFQTKDAQGRDTVTNPVGVYVVALMIGAAVHAALMTRERYGPGPVHPYAYGYGQQPGYGQPAYGYVPGPTQPQSAYPLYRQTYDMVPSDMRPQPPAHDSDAAEVQAGLRELRESLERGEDR